MSFLRRPPRILMYHAIAPLDDGDDDPNRIRTSPERFEAQMLYLKRRNLRGVSVRELRRAESVGESRGLVGLTFDDGYEDFLHTALPVLEGLGFTATVFAVAGMLGGENDWEHVHEPRPRMKLLGAEGLREVTERGMEVGSHSMSHPRLSGLDPGLLEREVGGSRRLLGEELGEEVGGFCYPYGSVDGAGVRAAVRAGYAYACAVNERVERGEHDLPRVPVHERDGVLRLTAKLEAYPQYSWVARRLR